MILGILTSDDAWGQLEFLNGDTAFEKSLTPKIRFPREPLLASCKIPLDILLREKHHQNFESGQSPFTTKFWVGDLKGNDSRMRDYLATKGF